MRRFVLLAAAGLACASCALPTRRPEADFVIRDCETDAELGGTVAYGQCLKLDGSGSRSFAGRSTFHWSYALADGSTEEAAFREIVGDTAYLPTTDPPGELACEERGGVICGRFFHTKIRRGASTALVRLTVEDGDGGPRSTTRELLLQDTPPTLSLVATPVRPRASDLFLNPFLIVHPRIGNADEDDLSIDVRAVSSDQPIAGFPCSAVPELTNDVYADPAPDDPHAWCFYFELEDKPGTPNVVENEPIFSPEPIDFRLRFRVRETFLDDGLPEDPSVENCEPRIPSEAVRCIDIRVEDVVWVASGGQVYGGRVGRVSTDWRRLVQPAGLSVRDGEGMAQENARVWMAARITPETVPARGGLAGLSRELSPLRVYGMGPVTGLRTDPVLPENALWVRVTTSDASAGGEPGAATRIEGEPYLLRLRSNLLPTAASPDLDLLPIPDAAFRTVSGFFRFGDPTFGTVLEVPVAYLPAADGRLWISTARFCPNHDGTQCTTNDADPDGVEYRLRIAPFGASGNVDVQSLPDLAAGTGATLDGFSPADTMALATTSGGIWFADTLDGIGTRIREISADGTAALHSFVLPGLASSIEYDVRRDILYVADTRVAGVIYRIQAPRQLSGAIDPGSDPGIDAIGPFSDVRAMAVEPAGGLWADDHPDPLSRQTIYIGPADTFAIRLPEYASFGRGIIPSIPGPANEYDGDYARGAWRPDLTDLVRAPLESPTEVPAIAAGPERSTVAGIDPQDGAAYVFAPVAGQNLFRIDTAGNVTPLGHLDQVPRCGTVAVEIPLGLFAPGMHGTHPPSLWLCQSDDGTEARMVEIELAHLREIARGQAPPIDGDLPACADGVSGACWRNLVTGLPTGIPRHAVFSLADFHLYVLTGDASCAASRLVGIFVTDVIKLAFPDVQVPDTVMTGNVAVPARCGAPGQPISAFYANEKATGEGIGGGVWLAQSDGRFQRWTNDFDAGGIVQDPSFRIGLGDVRSALSSLPGYAPSALATDLVPPNRAEGPAIGAGLLDVWTVFTHETDPAANLSYVGLVAVHADAGAMVLSTRGLLAVSSYAQAIATTPFSDKLWISGEDGKLLRVGARRNGELQLEYERLPNFLGSIGTTPAGRSMSAGGL